MRRITFSRHLTFVYTAVIAIPTICLVLVFSFFLRRAMYTTVTHDSENTVQEMVNHVENCTKEMMRIENVILSDYDLLHGMLPSRGFSRDEIIAYVIDSERLYSRLQFASPKVFMLRVYTVNPDIPERWPFFFKETRMDFSPIKRWTTNYCDSLMGKEISRQESLCLTSDLTLNKRHVGTLQISYAMTDVFPFLFNRQTVGEQIFLFSSENTNNLQLVETGVNCSTTIAEQINKLYMQSPSGSQVCGSGFSKKVIVWSQIPQLDLVIAHVTRAEVVMPWVVYVDIAIIAVVLFALILMLIIISFATKRLVSRVYLVADSMKKVRDGNLDVRVVVPGHDEITEMAEIFSSMVVKIKEQMEAVKQKQQLVTQTEVKAMQNQINAHFLYNVLESIKMQAELHDETEISESVTMLGKMMRYCLRWRNHRVCLYEELGYISSYIDLMNMRNDYVITLEVNIDHQYDKCQILKMLLQPIVENSVKYAIEPEGEDSTIELSVYEDTANQRLLFSVTDTGPGLSTENLVEIRNKLANVGSDASGSQQENGHGIGLINIQQRLQAFYGKNYSLIIQSTGHGLCVMVPVPLEVI